MKARRVPTLVLVVLIAIVSPFAARAQAKKDEPAPEGKVETSSSSVVSSAQLTKAASASPQAPQKYVFEGVAVEFTIETFAQGKEQSGGLLEGTEATVQFKITDNNTGRAITNLRPAAWLGSRRAGQTPDARECRERIQSYLQGGLSNRPDVDLNTYFILALNQEPNISVIDPLSGFGSSKLYTLVALDSPGADWQMSSDKKRIFVSLPLSKKVAVVDTATWKVVANIDAGAKPSRLVLQHDERFLWVGNDEGGEAQAGVTVIDTATLKAVAHLRTGDGHHDIIVTNDDRYAFITNKQSGTVSVVDISRLVKIKDLKTGVLPTALAFSTLSKTVYVINEGDGAIVVIDALRHEILTRINVRPGLRSVRFSPGGRYGFIVNPLANQVLIFDAANNRLLHTVSVGGAPNQISFTRNFAYVRSNDNELITMINLASIGKEGEDVGLARFSGGEKAPQLSGSASLADAVVPAPENGSVLVANPTDKMIYYYTEGMAAPMGSFTNYRRDPTAVLVLDKSLRETLPGVYTTRIRLNSNGNFDMAFLLDAPRVVHCFDVTVGANPELQKQRDVPIAVEPLVKDQTITVGSSYELRFKVLDAQTRRPKADLKDMGVLVFLSPGIWQQRAWAKPVGEGIYQVSFVPPQAGVYYVFFQCPSLGVRFQQIPSLLLRAIPQSNNSRLPVRQPEAESPSAQNSP